MPKKEIDYSNTIFYKIVCKDLNVKDIYVGHTTSFVKRKSMHKLRSVNDPAKVYNIIRQNGCWDNWDMIQIEKMHCADGNEARSRERYWYEKLNASLNTHVPSRSVEERLNSEEDKIRKKACSMSWRKNNSDKIKMYYIKTKEIQLDRQSANMFCECGCVIAKGNYLRHKLTKKHIDKLKSKL